MLRQIRQDDGVIEEVLARDVDDGAEVGNGRSRALACLVTAAARIAPDTARRTARTFSLFDILFVS